MTRVKWLIESSVFGVSSEPIKQEIRSQGMEFEILQTRPFLNGVVPEVSGSRVANDDCVIFWGSPPVMHHIRQHHRWLPGGWCNFENLNCAEYYPRLNQWLLNKDSEIGTIDDFQRDVNRLFDQFAKQSKVFVRPCTLEKVFTGQLVTKEDFIWTLERARYSNCQILVASPATISCEWRLVIHAGTVIASSQYRRGGDLEILSGCPDQVVRFVSEMCQELHWAPDELFVADVCESNGALYVLELNSFSCSGWYACDPAAIVTCAARLARESWAKENNTKRIS